MSAAPSPALPGLLSSRPTRPASPTAEQAARMLAVHFDILGPLHTLLSKLNPSIYTSLSLSSSSGPAVVSSTVAGDGIDQSAVQLMQLATAASDLKIRLTRAREVVGLLPDMDRMVDEQMDEIVALECRLAEAKADVAEIREAAHSVLAPKEAEDAEMGGVP